jgi:hypothetical protein
VLSAVIGFGAIGVSGTYAARARTAADPRKDPVLRRYFGPGTNWAARSLILTPVLGVTLILVGDRSAASQPWPWIGLGCWTLAAALATCWCWPAERRIQSWIADPGPLEENWPERRARLSAICRAVQWSASAISLCFLAAVVVMIWQPR